jgi:uncharacterized membrane protein
MAIKTIGIIISIFLLVQSIDSNNPLIQVLCNAAGGRAGCNGVLSSKAANAFWGFTWSDIGFFYFTGTWLTLLFGGNSILVWEILSVLNFISLPYTIYSVYYQAKVIKKWCVLCCSIQVLIWLEFFTIIYTKHSVSPHSAIILHSYITIIICMCLPAICWLLVKPFFLEMQEIGPIKKQLQAFKYNTTYFTQILTSQPKYVQPDPEWSIGKPLA